MLLFYSDLWPNVEVPLDFIGSYLPAPPEPPQTAFSKISKTTSRPLSQATSVTKTRGKQHKAVIPGVRGKHHCPYPLHTAWVMFPSAGLLTIRHKLF